MLIIEMMVRNIHKIIIGLINFFIREIFENDIISGITEIKYNTPVIKAVEPNPKRLNTSKLRLKKYI